jgi:uroporphyrinogen decarboxylase
MPQWLEYPVTGRGDWREFKKRLDPATPGRVGDNIADFAQPATADRGRPLGAWLGGTYGVMRDCCGVENLSLLFYDDPALIEDMMETLTRLSLGLVEQIVAAGVQLDWVMFWEDMAYKTASLIDPKMYERYCMPFYHAMMEKIRAAGVPVVMMDSDGNIHDLIPMWLDAGITVMHPMEVASGMDVVAARRQYGKRIAFFGGMDKRPLAGTRDDIRKEVLPKLEACYADGGLIAAVDHGIPPDISFDNFRYFRDLIRKTGERMYSRA